MPPKKKAPPSPPHSVAGSEEGAEPAGTKKTRKAAAELNIQKKKVSKMPDYAAEFEAPPVQRVGLKKKKGFADKSKTKAPAVENQFQQALQTTKDLEGDYRHQHQGLLEEIQLFNKSELKNIDDDVNDSDDESYVSEDEELKAAPKPETIGQTALCYNFWDEQSYPIHKIKFIVLQIPARAEVTLNFSGIGQLTDVVFAVMLNLKITEFARFKAVKRVVLDGCHLLTDAGISWMGEVFSEIQWLSLVGCNKVTDAGLISLSKLCPNLVSIDLTSTRVNFLPKRWANPEGMRMTGSPVLFPLAPDVNFSKETLKDDNQNLVKVCVVKRSNTSLSVISALKGEKQPAQQSCPQVESSISLNKNLTAVVMEFDESLSGLLVTGQSVVIIPSELKDKTQIHEEARTISALILQILGKHQDTQFLLLGCSTDQAGIIPTDMVRQEVVDYMQKISGLLGDSINALASLENMSVAKQLEYSSARRLQQKAQGFVIESVEINVDKASKEKDGILQAVGKAALRSAFLTEVNYTNSLYLWAKEFHSKCPKTLQTGIHTLNAAAKSISDSSKIKEKLRPFGAVHFLVKLGKLVMWESQNGETLVANSSWMCEYLRVLTNPDIQSEANNGRDPTLADDAKVWSVQSLQDEVKNKKLDQTQMEQLMKELPHLWLSSSSSVTTLANLSENSVMPTGFFTEFDKKSDKEGYHLAYSFVLNQNLTPAILQEILAAVLKLHRPIHVWKTGVIIHDSIVAVMVGQTGYSKVVNLCAYITSTTGESDQNAALIYNTAEKYRLVVTYVLTSYEILWEQLRNVSVSIQVPPENVIGLTHGHLFKGEDSRTCHCCGVTAHEASMLSAMDLTLNPAFFNKNDTKSSNLKGQITGSLVEITGPCDIQVRAAVSPFGSRHCSVLLMQGNVRLLIMEFRATNGDKVAVDLKEKMIKTTVGGQTVSQELSGILGTHSLQGEEIIARLTNDGTCQMEIYMGLQLLHTVAVPPDRYLLVISSKNFSEEGNTATLTVRANNFKSVLANVEKGMRLEALDRLNPSLICVATIQDIQDENVLIHFDGWTNAYDYWTNFSHEDLHPLGYMHYKGKELAKERRKRSDLQIPHQNGRIKPKRVFDSTSLSSRDGAISGYQKAFDWVTYLREVDAEPVPYECFNEKQTEGIPSDILVGVQMQLGTHITMPQTSSTQFCRRDGVSASHLEHLTKQYLAKWEEASQEYDKELMMRKHLFCFLPSQLSLDSLRFPALETVYSVQKQNLHYLCPGQVMDVHLVNHPGLPMDPAQLQDLKIWLGSMLPFYSQLMLQKVTLPQIKTSLCSGADKVPVDKNHQLEAAMKRLYKLYLMHCLFFWKARQELSVQHADVADKMLNAALQSDDNSFAQQFSLIPGSNSILCHGHRLANSPSAGLQEISIDKFQSMAGNIYVIHLENNPLSTLPADFFTHFSNLTQLWLDGCQIQELPALQKNICLEEIHMKGNALTTLPDGVQQLTALKILDISNNPMEVLPPVISKLESLVELFADNVGTVDLTIVTPLQNLNVLSVGQNYIESVPEKISALPLRVLDMSGLPLLSSGSSFSMALVTKFLDKYIAYRRLTKQERQVIVETVENLGEKANNSAKVAEFNRILFERFPRLGQMKQQKDTALPEAILKITSLEKLILPYHAFVSVPDSVQNLTKLEYLSVGNNPKLEMVSAQLARLPLKELHLRDCISLKTPPKEVVRRGFLAVIGYLKRLLQGSVPCKRTKLMMVGLGGAGKTSLVRALTNKHHAFYEDYGEQITDGIDITKWKVDIRGHELSDDDDANQQPLHFSVWDFAGQTVYYNTHQFFLSNRAVYLLLWNIRLGFEHAGLDFWLSSIACHAPKAPILVVGTHCDKVEKGKLPMEELKRRFQQIVGFHFVSSYSGEGIAELKNALIGAALVQKYMGERIPEAWLSLEKQLDSIRSKKEKALLPWKEVEDVANTAGIFEDTELVQAVQFLHDLGSVQFFNTNFLRSHVVIVPQWIVDVMACIVTVHEGPTKEGKLLYSDMINVWHDYPAELHPWLLRLTEEFDLTFPLSSEEANIVPCLLPNTEPKYDFAALEKEQGERESRMIYRFEYLPAGLFNRAQVRLHQFSDSSVMWKKGFMLKKNRHRALLLQVSNTEVVVTARGFKPENTLFLVHEVFECLIADSYSGVSYDYSIPCAECVAEFTIDPCMFPASKIKRAFDMKAPFLQCDKNFHIISIPEIQSTMPPDASVDFDDHLGRSVRELQDLEQSVAVRVLFIYTQRNIPDLANAGKVVDPTQVLNDLRTAHFNVSYCDNPETANMESMTLSIKSAQIVVFGISDEFVESPECRNLIIYTKQTLHKNIILLAIGKTLNWQKTDINLVLADEVFVKLIQAERYDSKFPELCEAIKTRSQKKKVDYPECFISYCWANSKTAVDHGSATTEGALGWGDPRKIKDFLQSKNINCWLDVEQMGQEGFFEDIADGLRKAKVMVAFVSDEYANSKNCRMEFRFAVSTLKIPTVLAVVGNGYQWERSEIGLLAVGHSQNCPKVNLQYENEAGLLDLLQAVQGFLPETRSSKESDNTNSLASQRAIAFQEVMELTQRKLLRHITMYSDNIDIEPYPRLVLIDLKTREQTSTTPRSEMAAEDKRDQEKTDDDDGDVKKDVDIPEPSEDGQEKSDKYCFRVLCEFEQGWHESPHPVSFPAKDGAALEEFFKNVSPYAARVLAVLKHSKINLSVLNTPEGEQMRKMIEEWCPKETSDFQNEYNHMLETVMDEDVNRTYGGLKRCHMPNGKILWLCSEHERSSFTQTEEKYKDQLLQGQDTAEDKGDMEAVTRPGTSMDTPRPQTAATDSTLEETPVAEVKATPQLAVKAAQPAGGQALPRRPKMARRATASKKTSSQACRLM